MIIDSRLQFANKTALSTSGTGLALVGDVVNLVNARDIGNKNNLTLVITVDTAVAATGGASSVEFQLVSDAQAAIATDGSATVHVKTGSIPKATLAAGYKLMVPLPPETPVYEQYLGLLQNVSTNAVTSGKINAFITSDPPVIKAYPDAI